MQSTEFRTTDKPKKNCRIIYEYTTNRLINILDPKTTTTRPYNPRTKESTIDVCLTKNVSSIPLLHVIDNLNSNHLPCIVELPVQKTEFLVYNRGPDLNKIVTKAFRQEMHKVVTINNNINTKQEIDASIKTLTAGINKPIFRITPPAKQLTYDNSLPDFIRKLIQNKRASEDFTKEPKAKTLKCSTINYQTK